VRKVTKDMKREREEGDERDEVRGEGEGYRKGRGEGYGKGGQRILRDRKGGREEEVEEV
jgi:hypothetical protein